MPFSALMKRGSEAARSQTPAAALSAVTNAFISAGPLASVRAALQRTRTQPSEPLPAEEGPRGGAGADWDSVSPPWDCSSDHPLNQHITKCTRSVPCNDGALAALLAPRSPSRPNDVTPPSPSLGEAGCQKTAIHIKGGGGNKWRFTATEMTE